MSSCFATFYFWLQHHARESTRSAHPNNTENLPVHTGASRETLHRAYAVCQEEGIGKGLLESHLFVS